MCSSDLDNTTFPVATSVKPENELPLFAITISPGENDDPNVVLAEDAIAAEDVYHAVVLVAVNSTLVVPATT